MAIDWVTEVAKVGMSGIITLTGVFLGAKYALSNADRGRRDDILFKSRMEAYNKVGILYLKYISNLHSMRSIISISKSLPTDSVEIYNKEAFKEIGDALKAFESSVSEMQIGISLFPEEVVAKFIASSDRFNLVGALFNLSTFMNQPEEERNIKRDEFKKLADTLIEVIREYIEVSEEMLDEMNKALGLRGVKPFYSTARHLYLRVEEIMPPRDQYGMRIPPLVPAKQSKVGKNV